MKAKEFINKRSFHANGIGYPIISFGEALDAADMAFKEGSDTLINQASQNSQKKYELGKKEMKEKALKLFQMFVEDYCHEAGFTEIRRESEHYIDVFTKMLEEKQ